MEVQTQEQAIRKKLAETIERSSQLITTNKHYEFTQKIKMLAQRKIQTNKIIEAEILLELGINKMFEQTEIEFNATHDLVASLLELYQKHRDRWSMSKASQIFRILIKNPHERNLEFCLRILKGLSHPNQVPEITEYIINYYQKNQQFSKAESLVMLMDLSRAMTFLERWGQKMDRDEKSIAVCRMALLYWKGLLFDFDEPMVLLSELDSLNPFVKFTKFLILSVQMKSRESFEKMGMLYRKFLDSDSFFDKIYESYGMKFFKKGKPGAGLLDLFEK